MCSREREGEGEGGENQRERGCVRIHMPIELVCSDGEGGGPSSPAHLMLEVLLQLP